MALFSGKIGFAVTQETEPGIWVETITERKYKGNVLNRSRRLENNDKINDDIIFTNEISIVADPFAIQNLNAMRYIEFMGVKWKISNVTFNAPRLNLTTGGLYNG